LSFRQSGLAQAVVEVFKVAWPLVRTVLKLHAAVILSDDPPDIAMPSRYVEGCKRWFAALSDSQKLVALEMVRVLKSGDEDKALSMAAALPAAPRL
jgi:hypothetical protein